MKRIFVKINSANLFQTLRLREWRKGGVCRRGRLTTFLILLSGDVFRSLPQSEHLKQVRTLLEKAASVHIASEQSHLQKRVHIYMHMFIFTFASTMQALVVLWFDRVYFVTTERIQIVHYFTIPCTNVFCYA